MKAMVYGDNDSRTEILVNDTYKGIQYVALNIHGSHPCCYVNLPEDHPWAKLLGYNDCDYNDIPVECHYGLTFGEDHLNAETHMENNTRIYDTVLPGNWIGWDYAHFEDFTWYPGREPHKFENVWTTTELIADCKKVIDQVVEAYGK